ncbi:MAG: anaerobic ribonucleoside-triphosphate reductase activating protein [Finegoldia magna]|uniref:anaerobic ribonucleoside-triphosphate reductase activating protein n=1 Tax=Finegoldia magna TaxID=1260 RepID=UPI0026EB2E4D|nr:anaerobic ribonucleoside-triphosphate reductase activating protein [Finegoldia magna]MBS5966231.1 anaerobic ribonucleoside-triphosphate reductase activating protein [Finegoldia magna]
MNYAQIRQYDVANGPGIRCTFFVTGCSLNCKNCFNKEYQDPNFGDKWTDTQTNQVIDYLEQEEIDGLTILGGEPFESCDDLIEIVGKIRENTNKSIWIFSGYTYEILYQKQNCKKLLDMCDVLVDGRFVEELKDLRLKFRGSSNQRLIDLNKTTIDNIILVDENKL